jgi:hypothetical protein
VSFEIAPRLSWAPTAPNFGAGADFGPPSDTLTFTFSEWAEAAQLETLGAGVGMFEEQVIAAWAHVAAPVRAEITDHQCGECDEIADYFADRPWQELTNVGELRYHADALHLFSNKAFHYYLPAFMRVTLVNPDEADMISTNIVVNFRNEFGASSRDRLALFGPRQRELVAEFIATLAERGIEEIPEVDTLTSLLRRA